MCHNHRIHLPVRHRRLVPTGIEPAGIDFPGDLLGLHPVAGTGQEVNYGFGELHDVQIYGILRIFAIYKWHSMNPNTEFERFTQRIYQKLVNNDVIKPTTVKHNVKLKGKSGCEHQIDVYWEYEMDGIINRVAIECKNYDSNVSIGKVREFLSVLLDLDNVRGIMVTSKGYQKGARKFAEYYGISLKKLRRPEWNESIGSITTEAYAEIRHNLFLIDEEWAKEHNFSVERYRDIHVRLYPDKADYWRVATHLPIETVDNNIRDSQGNVISSIKNLGLVLLEKQDPGTIIIFPFKDGWVESRYWGPVRIREVKFEYESKVQETTMNLAAEDFVEAILEDALGSEAKYVPKY